MHGGRQRPGRDGAGSLTAALWLHRVWVRAWLLGKEHCACFLIVIPTPSAPKWALAPCPPETMPQSLHSTSGHSGLPGAQSWGSPCLHPHLRPLDSCYFLFKILCCEFLFPFNIIGLLFIRSNGSLLQVNFCALIASLWCFNLFLLKFLLCALTVLAPAFIVLAPEVPPVLVIHLDLCSFHGSGSLQRLYICIFKSTLGYVFLQHAYRSDSSV